MNIQPCRDSRPRLRRPKEHDLRTKDTEGALGEGEHGVGLGAESRGRELGEIRGGVGRLRLGSAADEGARTQQRTRRRRQKR